MMFNQAVRFEDALDSVDFNSRSECSKDFKTNLYSYSSENSCLACSSNQTTEVVAKKRNNRNSKIRKRKPYNRQIKDNYMFIKEAMTRISPWSAILFIWMGLCVGFTEGLQCYECLSLYCDSGAVCDAIKSTMVDIFVPKRHFIHFDPADICPEEELPMNAIQWANISRECERSDSICLISPIEVHTVVDGKKHGKRLENEYTLMTYGYLRGCASRRKLLEFPETINVRIEFSGRNNESKNRQSNGTSANNRNNGTSPERNQVGSNKKKSEIFYNMTNIGNGADVNPNRKTYKDGYTISKIYSHVFYIDQGTKNATRCYADNCNDKVKFRRAGTSGINMLTFSNFYVVFSLIVSLIFFI